MSIGNNHTRHIIVVLAVLAAVMIMACVTCSTSHAAGPDKNNSYIQFASSTGFKFVYSTDFPAQKVSGAKYKKSLNTLFLTDVKMEMSTLETINMGSDFKIVLSGKNSLGSMYIISATGSNSVSIGGSGSLELNKKDFNGSGLTLSDWTESKTTNKIKIANGPTITIYKGKSWPGKGTVVFESDKAGLDAKKLFVNTGKCSPAVSFTRVKGSGMGKYDYVDRHDKLKISPRKTLKKSNTKITVKSCTYNGKAQKPEVTVKYDKNKLKKGTDFTVSYSNNTSAGSSAKVKITGKGGYIGSITKKFTIEKRKMSDKAVTASIVGGSYHEYYDGTAKKPDVTVKFKQTSSSTITLKKGTHFSVSYKNNKNAGTGKVILKGKGNYKGTRTVGFKIKRIAQDDVHVKQSPIKLTADDIGKTVKLTVTGLKEKPVVKGRSTNDNNIAEFAKDTTLRINGPGRTPVFINYDATTNYEKGTVSGSLTVQDIVIGKGEKNPLKYDPSLGMYTVACNGNRIQTGASAGGLNEDSEHVKLKFKSLDKTVAAVDSNGVMTPKKPGTVVIRVSSSETFVYAPYSKDFKIKINKADPVIKQAVKQISTQNASAPVAKITQGAGKVTYASSDTKIATVDSAGRITPKKAMGKVQITVKVSGSNWYNSAEEVFDVDILTIDNPAIYMKQDYGSVFCTKYACGHMMIRRAILDGRSDWTKISKKAMDDNGSAFSKAVWSNGLKGTFSYDLASGYTLKCTTEDMSSGMTEKGLANLLKSHPEGIECYDTSIPHAVLVTSYDANTKTFYCVDSDPGQPGGIIKLADCLNGDRYDHNQNTVLKNFKKYWYLYK